MARATTGKKTTATRKRRAEQPDVDDEGIHDQVTSQGEELAMPSTKPRRESEDADAEDEDASGDASPSEDDGYDFDEDEDEDDDFDDFDDDIDDVDEDEGGTTTPAAEPTPTPVPAPAPPPESVEGKALRLIGAMVTITEILGPDRLNKLREVCPPGELSDSMDAAIRPAHVNLDRLMRKWVNGRP